MILRSWVRISPGTWLFSLSIVRLMCQDPQVASLLSFSNKNGFPAALHLIRVYLPWPKRISLFWCYACRYELGQCCSWWLKWSSPVVRQTCLPLQPYHLKQKGLKGQYEKCTAHHLVEFFCGFLNMLKVLHYITTLFIVN